MIRHIFKYVIPDIGKVVSIKIPKIFSICEAAQQDGSLCLWAIVDIHCPLVEQKFMVVGTGWQIHEIENMKFIKTVHMPNGLVWHVFLVEDDINE